MTSLADRIGVLKGIDPDEIEDDDDDYVAELMENEAYVEGRRDRLPKRFTDGRKIDLAHIFVYRDHLPKKRIVGKRIPCAILWEEPNSFICTRPAERKERRRQPSEDD